MAKISQSSFLLPILFLFYNAVLLKEIAKRISVAGFVDNIAILVEGKLCKKKTQQFFSTFTKKFATLGLAVMAASLPPKSTNSATLVEKKSPI